MTQANAIQEQLDPFRSSRSREHLGSWILRQPGLSWYRLTKPNPLGPVISARLKGGLCGVNQIAISRLPLGVTGKASWTSCLSIFHGSTFRIRNGTKTDTVPQEKGSDSYIVTIEERTPSHQPHPKQDLWLSLPVQPLVRHGSAACVKLDRATLITLLSLSNARQMFRYSDASGHRAAYASYCGHWYIEWPLGGAAVIRFAPHDSHNAATDVYPQTFNRRVDKCIQMTAGVIVLEGQEPFRCAFPGRKPPGRWILQYQRRGFPGAHGSRHLYNMMGGKVYEVDFLHAGRLETDDPSNCLKLELPSLEKNLTNAMFIPEREQNVMAHALDCLPWDSLSWSIHRGLRDLLVAFAKPTMDKHRKTLASQLCCTVSQRWETLRARGWAVDFINETMGDLAANSIMAGGGNSGDSVRVVTDIAFLLWPDHSSDLDETTFWREERHRMSGDENELSPSAVIALTKCFILEWSNEFDYQMYHDLPTELAFA